MATAGPEHLPIPLTAPNTSVNYFQLYPFFLFSHVRRHRLHLFKQSSSFTNPDKVLCESKEPRSPAEREEEGEEEPGSIVM